jgi:hypothetical protein
MSQNITNKWSTWYTCNLSEKTINLQHDALINPLMNLMTYYCNQVCIVLLISHYDGYRLNLTIMISLRADIMLAICQP